MPVDVVNNLKNMIREIGLVFLLVVIINAENIGIGGKKYEQDRMVFDNIQSGLGLLK